MKQTRTVLGSAGLGCALDLVSRGCSDPRSGGSLKAYKRYERAPGGGVATSVASGTPARVRSARAPWGICAEEHQSAQEGCFALRGSAGASRSAPVQAGPGSPDDEERGGFGANALKGSGSLREDAVGPIRLTAWGEPEHRGAAERHAGSA